MQEIKSLRKALATMQHDMDEMYSTAEKGKQQVCQGLERRGLKVRGSI